MTIPLPPPGAAIFAAFPLAFALVSEPSDGPDTAPVRASTEAEALYREHCAKCHGENGDGQGVTELDRPARSFLDGGYSYGNTPNAVRRSVVHGIPGTPMPAFGETLNDEQIAAVAQFVIDLGPPGTVVEPGMSVLTVEDRPRVVHGMMPALKGGFREPRSVLVGFPNGTTFQYTKDDGRLQAMRQGEFLDRRDWGGRGGAPLNPLGQITWNARDAGLEGPEYVDEEGKPLRRKLVRSQVAGTDVHLRFALFEESGQRVGGGTEVLSFLEVEGIPVAVRAIVATGNGRAIRARIVEGQPESVLIAGGEVDASNRATDDPPLYFVRRAADGLFCVDREDLPALRVYVHAQTWTPELGAAVAASLSKEG